MIMKLKEAKPMMTTDHDFFIQIINGKKDLKKLIYLLQLVQQMK